eukprot:5433399-Alexandrium_andersonii.AAC.1
MQRRRHHRSPWGAADCSRALVTVPPSSEGSSFGRLFSFVWIAPEFRSPPSEYMNLRFSATPRRA